MKFAICTKRDLAGNLALNRLVRALAPRHEVHVVLSDYVLKAERQNQFAFCLLRHERDLPIESVFPYLEQAIPGGIGAANLTFEQMASSYGITIEEWGRARAPRTIQAMRRIAPDVILSCRYDYIFPEDILTIPRYGAYGMHPGMLPQIQGLCGPFRAMQMGHSRSGCTLFHIDAGIDSGAVIDIGWADIDYRRSVLWNFVQTYLAGIDVFLHYLPILERGERLSGNMQDVSQQSYYGYPSEEEFRQFIAGDGCLVSMEDYLELLSLYLPNGLADTRMTELKRLFMPLN